MAKLRISGGLLRGLGLVVASLTMSVLAWWGMIHAYPNRQSGDGVYFFRSLEAVRMSVQHHHEWPFWNPYECGGVPLWDNPQGLATSPLVHVLLPFGSGFTLATWYVLHSAAGFFGMWLFSRRSLALGFVGSFLAASAFAFSGFHWQHYSGGHASFVAFELFPLALLLSREAERSLRAAAGLGFLLGWMLLGAATYPLPHLALFLGAEMLTRIFPLRRLGAILRGGVVTGVIAFLVGAMKLFPLLAQFEARPRGLGPEADTVSLDLALDMFLARTHDWHVPGQAYVWPEYGAFLGPIALAFAVLGLFALGRRRLFLLPLFALAWALMAGHFSPHAPWTLLKGHVFPFKEMRVPSRFVAEVSLFLAAFAGIGVDAVSKLSARRFRTSAAREIATNVLFVAAVLGAGDLLFTPMPWIESRFTYPVVQRKAPVARLYVGGPGMGGPLEHIGENRASLSCHEDWGDLAGAPLWDGDVPQARAKDDAVVVEVGNRTQNTFTVDVDAKRGGRILLNSNYDRNWRADVGTVVAEGKLLAVDVPEGRHRIEVRYRPKRVFVGMTLTVVGIVLTLFFLVTGGAVRLRKRR